MTVGLSLSGPRFQRGRYAVAGVFTRSLQDAQLDALPKISLRTRRGLAHWSKLG
jgi:hypothetical protein